MWQDKPHVAHTYLWRLLTIRAQSHEILEALQDFGIVSIDYGHGFLGFTTKDNQKCYINTFHEITHILSSFLVLLQMLLQHAWAAP